MIRVSDTLWQLTVFEVVTYEVPLRFLLIEDQNPAGGGLFTPIEHRPPNKEGLVLFLGATDPESTESVYAKLASSAPVFCVKPPEFLDLIYLDSKIIELVERCSKFPGIRQTLSDAYYSVKNDLEKYD